MIKVSVICLTYNHEKYITEALEGFLNQKTDFEFEVLVHDDKSTDSTSEILKKYAAESKGIIKPIFETENQFSKGNFEFVNSLFMQAKGDYIALCEGDDFWTDSDKLQAQVDLFESHSNYSVVFHRVKVFVEGSAGPVTIFPDPNEKIDFTVSELLKRNFIQTNSVMYRRQNYDHIPSSVIPGDWYMHLYHAQFGEIGFIDKVMSAYRKHPGGVWWDSEYDVDAFWRKYGAGHFALFAELLKLYGKSPVYEPIISTWVASVLSRLIYIDDKYGTALADRALSSYPQPKNYYIKIIIAHATQELREKSILTDNHIHNLQEQVDGLSAYVKKLENDIRITTHELQDVHSSRVFKLLKLLNHKFRSNHKD